MTPLISPDTLRHVRNGVCAVGYVTVPLADYLKDPKRPYFKVVGTGFLVRAQTAITNRHVVQGLLESQAENGFPDQQRLLMFVLPEQDAQWHVGFAVITRLAYLSQPELDVGFCDFDRTQGPSLDRLAPLELRVDERLNIGDPVFVAGYPFGHAMLHRDGKVYRWGPVVQSGMISALSPYDTAKEPDEILLDVRAAGGMSGAPIYSPLHDKVIGVLHSGWEATTALAVPLREDTVKQWLATYDAQPAA